MDKGISQKGITMSKEISSAMDRGINDLADKDYELLLVLMVKPNEKFAVIVDQSGESSSYSLPDDLVQVARDMTIKEEESID